jgi:nicotinamide phosphoribosyltransferase
MYPRGMNYMHSYFECRTGAKYPNSVFFGLSYIIAKIQECIVNSIYRRNDYIEVILKDHFGKEIKNFNSRKTLEDLNIRIRGVEEGSIVPINNVLFTVESTGADPHIVSFLETYLVQTWYPITVATLSYYVKKDIRKSVERTGGDINKVPFMLHDFGVRGASSMESAAIGGAAHLVNFLGTDNLPALELIGDYYYGENEGFSIPASEHSVISSWGRDRERDAYRAILDAYPEGLLACVSDTYDIYNAVEKYWCGEFKDEILARNGTFVIRPDSGDPAEVVVNILNIMKDKLPYNHNEKGFIVFPKQYAIIQGDGCSPESIKEILLAIEKAGFCTDICAYGMGGGLLQKVDRDTQKCAYKCSNVEVNGVSRDVYKDPITDKKKISKKGKLDLIVENEEYKTVPRTPETESKSKLITYFENGRVEHTPTFSDIRKLVNS